MFGCVDTVLQNMASSSNTLPVSRHWIPRSTNQYTIAMAEKANCNENQSTIFVFNDYNNNGVES